MPIYGHEVSAGLRRSVAALPVFGSAATNTVVLGVAIVLVVVAICMVFGMPQEGKGAGATARRVIRCIVYSLPVVLVLLYVFAGSVAATVEGGAAADINDLIAGPVRSDVRPRGDLDAPLVPGALAPPRPEPAPLPSAATSVSAQLARIEADLGKV